MVPLEPISSYLTLLNSDHSEQYPSMPVFHESSGSSSMAMSLPVIESSERMATIPYCSSPASSASYMSPQSNVSYGRDSPNTSNQFFEVRKEECLTVSILQYEKMH